jgi:hypothetical protein
MYLLHITSQDITVLLLERAGRGLECAVCSRDMDLETAGGWDLACFSSSADGIWLISLSLLSMDGMSETCLGSSGVCESQPMYGGCCSADLEAAGHDCGFEQLLASPTDESASWAWIVGISSSFSSFCSYSALWYQRLSQGTWIHKKKNPHVSRPTLRAQFKSLDTRSSSRSTRAVLVCTKADPHRYTFITLLTHINNMN